MDSSGVSWSRVRALPFFNMSQIRQLMNGNNPVYGLPRFGNRDFVNTGLDDLDEYDYDKSENMEDESNIIIPTFDELLRRKRPEPEDQSDTESQTSGGLSGDSLAFTLVYVSVFSVTLLYVGLKLAKRWRARQSRVSSTEESPTTPPVELPPCGHPQCSRVTTNPSTGRRYLPYTGLGGAWIPEIMTFQGFPLTQAQAQVHNTALCRGRCGPCRALALPPPSYTKLFLEEQPPAYDDSVVIKQDGDDNNEEATEESVDIVQEANYCTVEIECESAEECDAKEETCKSISSDKDSPENSLLNSNS